MYTRRICNLETEKNKNKYIFKTSIAARKWPKATYYDSVKRIWNVFSQIAILSYKKCQKTIFSFKVSQATRKNRLFYIGTSKINNVIYIPYYI